MSDWHRFEIASPTGARLNAYAISPPERPRCVVQINHGLAEHSARYERFARFLASRGYAAIAHDHRGHGHTTAPDAPQGRFADRDGLDRVLADIDAVIRHAGRLHPDVPVVCFGHSMGALLAMNHCLRAPASVAAGAFWNTNVQWSATMWLFRLLLLGERMTRGSDVPSAIAPKLTFDAWNRGFAPNRTGFDWLSSDAAEVDRYVADPLCGFDASVSLWLDVAEAVRRASDLRAWHGLPRDFPLHLLGGGADPYSEKGRAMEALARRLASMGMARVELALYPENRHEALNEVDRDRVMAGFAAWLDSLTPA